MTRNVQLCFSPPGVFFDTPDDLFEPRLQFGFHAFCKWKISGLFSTTPAKANAASEPGAKSCSVNKVVSLQFVFEELRISGGIE
ncbi:hypothetical protein CBS147324_4753 [Aspergillus niger]|nr:hypothetical protein CBS147324_4753 [Aspergillus niger]